MPLDFEFLTPRRIVFGWGKRRELGPLAATLGRRAFVVLGSRTLLHGGGWKEVAGILKAANVDPVLTAMISHEPEVADVNHLAWQLRQHDAGPGDFLLALGGGSAMDLAKAAAALVTDHQTDTVLDFLENVGKGLQVENPPLPLLVMPTTGGTGTEATKNAVISSYDPPFKKSIRSPLMVPAIVLIDPELSIGVSPETTAFSGMDAITQLIESYVTKKANPLTQALSIEGLRLALPHLREAVRDGTSRPAREAMAYAALLSGIAFANSGLGLAHGIAPALGCVKKTPHGKACAMLLPVALDVNRDSAMSQFATIARRALDVQDPDDANAAQALRNAIQSLCDDLGIPKKLSDLGVTAADIDPLMPLCRGTSMSGNPRQLDDAELRGLLESLL